MSEQEAAAANEAEQQQTADSSEQETGTPEPTINWEERAKEHQSWGTRLAQENAELKREAELVQALRSDDPDLQRQALEALGYQVPEEDPPDDPTEALQRKLAELEQWRDEFTGNQHHNEQLAAIESHVERDLQQIGGLTDPQKDWIVARAVALPPTQQGLPDIQAAHAEYQALIDAEKQTWAKTKPRSALASPAGQEGTTVPDMSTHSGRMAHYASLLEAEQR